MNPSVLLWLVAGTLALGITGCKDRQEQPLPPSTPAARDEHIDQSLPLTPLTTTGVLAAIRIRTPTVPRSGPVAVDSRALKSLFPRRIGVLKLKSVVQDTFAREPQPEAMAKAQYESPLAGYLQITITDFGRPPDQLETRFGLTWLGVHIDRETDRGYERDGRYGPFRYYEAFNRSGGYGQINVLWNSRLLIELESYRLPAGYLLQALRAINWDQVFPLTGAPNSLLIPPDAAPASP